MLLKIQGWFQFLSKGFLFGAQTTPATKIIFISSQLNPRHHKSLKTERKKRGSTILQLVGLRYAVTFAILAYGERSISLLYYT